MSNRKTEILDKVREIVLNHLQGYSVKVFLFGSRARGDARKTSDIDIAILPDKPLPPHVLSTLREALFESTIPYQVEIVDLSYSDPTFKANVMKDAILWTV